MRFKKKCLIWSAGSNQIHPAEHLLRNRCTFCGGGALYLGGGTLRCNQHTGSWNDLEAIYSQRRDLQRPKNAVTTIICDACTLQEYWYDQFLSVKSFEFFVVNSEVNNMNQSCSYDQYTVEWTLMHHKQQTYGVFSPSSTGIRRYCD